MIATRRGLAIACGVAVVLAIALGLDVWRRPAPADRAVLPGFAPAAAHGLIWQRPGQPDVVLADDAGWRLAAGDGPGAVPDAGAVLDVLDTLRGARWHRRGPATPSHVTVTVQTSQGDHVIGVGEPVAGGDQVWLTVDGRGALVDRWIARALDVAPERLRVAAPFDPPAAWSAIELARAGAATLALAPRPWRLIRPAPVVIAAAPAAALDAALAGIVFVRFADGRPGAVAPGVTVTAHPGDGHAVTVTVGGACPGAADLVAIAGSYGRGCIAADAAAALDHAVAALADVGAVIEPRPVPVAPARVTLPDGAVLDVVHGQIDGAAADPDPVAAVIAALVTPGTPVARPTRGARATLIVAPRAGDPITLELLGDDLVARAGEPLALRLGAGAIAALTRPGRALRELTPWLEEPTTISAIAIDAATYTRGSVIGAWSGAVEPRSIDALVTALAAPRPLRALDPPVTVRHHVTLTVAPPAGAAITHALGIGAVRPDGCPAQIADVALLLPAAVCTALDQIRPK